METKVVEKGKEVLKVEVRGADHAIMGMLRDKLTEDKTVEFATYYVPHPLLEGFVISLRGKDPEKSLKTAVAGMKEDAKALEAAFQKAK